MTTLQAIHIVGVEERQQPSPHTVYKIEVKASVRSWNVWRRYSEFDELNKELTKTTELAPPAPVPGKHVWSLRSSFRNKPLIEERRSGLETYLRAILSAKDGRWRDAPEFKEFLGVPVGKAPSKPGERVTETGQFTSSSWLDEQSDLQTLVRDIRADIQKRDALSDRADVAGSHTANVEAQKKIAVLLSRIGMLAKGLQGLAVSGMSDGEMQRRSDMVARLQDDCEKLGKMVIAARRASKPIPSLANAAANAASGSSPRNAGALLGLGTPPSSRPAARVFGTRHVPQETAETRPLDETGLVQMQDTQMNDQDQQLRFLSTILKRQQHLGTAISTEIAEQNDLLDGLNNDVDRVTSNLGSARKLMNKVS